MPKVKTPARGASGTRSRSRVRSIRSHRTSSAQSTPVIASSTSAVSGRCLLPIKKAAVQLGLTTWGLRAWVYAGKISHHKIGDRVMIATDEIERIIRESERPRVAQYV